MNKIILTTLFAMAINAGALHAKSPVIDDNGPASKRILYDNRSHSFNVANHFTITIGENWTLKPNDWRESAGGLGLKRTPSYKSDSEQIDLFEADNSKEIKNHYLSVGVSKYDHNFGPDFSPKASDKLLNGEKEDFIQSISWKNDY
jgi:hypothetical protein